MPVYSCQGCVMRKTSTMGGTEPGTRGMYMYHTLPFLPGPAISTTKQHMSRLCTLPVECSGQGSVLMTMLVGAVMKHSIRLKRHFG